MLPLHEQTIRSNCHYKRRENLERRCIYIACYPLDLPDISSSLSSLFRNFLTHVCQATSFPTANLSNLLLEFILKRRRAIASMGTIQSNREATSSCCPKITVHREEDLLKRVIKAIAIARYLNRASITAIRRSVSSISIRWSNIGKETERCVASSSSNDRREPRNSSVFHSMNRVQQKRSVDA